MTIIRFYVEEGQAAALLKFLRHVAFDAVAEALDDAGEEIAAFNEASERLRVALATAVEPEEE
jgi:hypothetical protein